MISAQTLHVCREGKPVPTFPDHALAVIEMTFYALTFAAWAALGFPVSKTFVAFVLLIIVAVVAYRWVIRRQP
jgi:hypothetical protein